MNEKTLELLCEKLGTTVEYLVPKAQAYGISCCIAVIVICCLAIGFEFLYVKHLRNKYVDLLVQADIIELALAITGGVFVFIVFIALIGVIPELIMWITAPELGLLGLVK